MFKFITRKLVVFIIASVFMYLQKVEWYCWIIIALIFIDDVIINRALIKICGGEKWK